MTTKDELIQIADDLGLDSSGTKAELQARIDAFNEANDSNSEGEKDSGSEGTGNPEEEKPRPKVVPRAVPVAKTEPMETATCLVTTVKMIGGWRHLSKGKTITAPVTVIEALRKKKMVK